MTYALIIDDNRQTADAMRQMLEILNIECAIAYGSSPGITFLRKEVPDLIMLDINMPGVDGFEVLAYLKREPRLSAIPVFVVTSDDQPETRQRATQLGAVTVLIKPATLDAIEDALKGVGIS
jgi:CheY-like chemotaxis protein